ncbi:hypothetical protein KVR01_012699 [Diaporthe batatas]|uniref:uncharacterized protein n=1 Tax=Diaporthe batatas TaxID=748121 RepID=UPI001D045C43|nr:uncharacterized protein KVR01_012699 [Diaporthe batatas]KAG8157315.1 hypothetical protein KVR01_012699 [Diaporthe batatas]
MPNANNTGPGYPEGYQPASGHLANIIDNSVATGLDKWGFVILRGVYDNDDEWQTFLSLYKAAVADELHDAKLEDQLGQQLEWTVIEDPAILDGASKGAVRGRFLTWVEEQKRDGEIADRPWAAGYLPRYKFCLYVDEVCMKSIVARQQGGKLDYTLDEEDEEDADEGWGELDGTTNYDVGWAYIDVLGYAALYSNLGSGGSHDQIWDGMVYRGRRPERDPKPDYNYGCSLADVERGVPYGQRISR